MTTSKCLLSSAGVHNMRAACGPRKARMRPAASSQNVSILELYAVFADPLGVDVASLPPEMQLEVIDIQNCSSLRSLLREKGLIEFYKCLDVTQHQAVVANALKLVSTFGSSYICEQGFSVMNLNKSKLRSRLTDDHLRSIMRVACSNLSPDIGRLAANMKCNVSH